MYRQPVVARSYRPAEPAAWSNLLVDREYSLRNHRIPAMLPCCRKGDSELLGGMFRLCSQGNVLASLQAPCMSPLSCRASPRVLPCVEDRKEADLADHTTHYDFGLRGVSLALCPHLSDFELTFSPLSWTEFRIVSVYFWTYVHCIVFEGQKLSIKVCLIEFDTQSLKSGHHLH